jgi:hypothetical protein
VSAPQMGRSYSPRAVMDAAMNAYFRAAADRAQAEANAQAVRTAAHRDVDNSVSQAIRSVEQAALARKGQMDQLTSRAAALRSQADLLLSRMSVSPAKMAVATAVHASRGPAEQAARHQLANAESAARDLQTTAADLERVRASWIARLQAKLGIR